MKIVTWNVNGIRSRVFNEQISSKLKKNEVIYPQESSPIKTLIEDYDLDIICIQETRCSVENSKKYRFLVTRLSSMSLKWQMLEQLIDTLVLLFFTKKT